MSGYPLKGRVVLITGASGGIGRAAALAYAKAGVGAVVLAARRKEALEQTALEVEALGARAVPIVCDVTRPGDVTELMLRTQETFGGLDILVNNAGLGLYGPVEDFTEEQVREVFELNVFALIRVTKAALPLLRARKGGQIVNVSSVLGHRGLPLLGGYCASKAAVNVLSESLRAELLSDGIDVLLVSPGLTDTSFRDARLNAPGWAQEQIPLEAMSAEAVADELVKASQKRRRLTVLTLPGKAMVLANRAVPGLMDRMARRFVGPPKKADA